MWFSVICSLIDSDSRHHSGQNLWPQEVPSESATKCCGLKKCRVSPQQIELHHKARALL